MIRRLLAPGVRLLVGVYLQSGLTAPARSRIYFANHGSNLDFVVIWSVLPPALRERTRPVAAHDYWTKGKVRPFLADHVFRAVLVERRAVTRANNPLEKMIATLAGGEDLILFPEGTRSHDGRIHEFKAGLFHLAKQFPEAELLPVHLENLSRILPKGEFLPVPIIARVCFGQPLPPLGEKETKVEFLTRARAAVCELGRPQL